jgi:hypothetical protein
VAAVRSIHFSRRGFLASLSPAIAASMCAAERDPFAYKTGYSSIMKLGKDLHAALKREHRELIAEQPISIETNPTPFARPLYLDEKPKPVRGVWISAGFIDLVNHIAHAEAIDRLDRNYFARYSEMLAEQNVVPPLPDGKNARYWSEEVLNEQQSNFNSIVGFIVGVKLANHYLGHYDRYRAKLSDSAINNLLSEKEWNEAFRAGLHNALRAGCMIEGVVPLFVAIDKIKKRPDWVAHFLPDRVSPSSLAREMERTQKHFLRTKD